MYHGSLPHMHVQGIIVSVYDLINGLFTEYLHDNTKSLELTCFYVPRNDSYLILECM